MHMIVLPARVSVYHIHYLWGNKQTNPPDIVVYVYDESTGKIKAVWVQCHPGLLHSKILPQNYK